MSFGSGGGGQQAPPPLPALPPPPANPPIFGSDATRAAGQRQRSQAGAAPTSILGGITGGGNPTNTGQKTLLGA